MRDEAVTASIHPHTGIIPTTEAVTSYRISIRWNCHSLEMAVDSQGQQLDAHPIPSLYVCIAVTAQLLKLLNLQKAAR